MKRFVSPFPTRATALVVVLLLPVLLTADHPPSLPADAKQFHSSSSTRLSNGHQKKGGVAIATGAHGGLAVAALEVEEAGFRRRASRVPHSPISPGGQAEQHGDFQITGRGSGGELETLVRYLEGIEYHASSCADRFGETVDFLQGDVVAPHGKIDELVSSIERLQRINAALVQNYKKILRLARLIPKWGLAAGPAIRVARWTDRVASLIVSRLTKFHILTLVIVASLKTISADLEDAEKTMDGSKSIAFKSINAAKAAQRCALATATDVDDAAIEMFAGSINPLLAGIYDATKGCLDWLDEIRDKIPSFEFVNELMAFFADVATPLAEGVTTMAEQVMGYVANEETKSVCCDIVPHQITGLIGGLSSLIDLATCFADPLVERTEHFLLDIMEGISLQVIEEVPLFEIQVPKITFEGIGIDPSNDCALIALANSFAFETYSISMPELSFDLQEILDTPDPDDNDKTFAEAMNESCRDGKEKLTDDWMDVDCCCIASDVMLCPGTACLKPEALWMGSTDVTKIYQSISTMITGRSSTLPRCTCCEDGNFMDDGSGEGTAICGTEITERKSAPGGSCRPSGVQVGPNAEHMANAYYFWAHILTFALIFT